MESSVTSQISPKVYTGEISKLYKNDIDAQSELFEINIFNSTLHIAPGKSISDEENDKLVYFYVYAIKDDKVVANLGVYELLTDEQKLLYDISTFENLLLFDYYYTNPTKIKEFEITGKNNIFDYIKTHLEYIPVDKALLIYNTFARFRRDQKESIGSEQHQSIFKKIIGILSKDIKTKGLDDEKINQLKENTTNVEILKITLAILEPFLNVQFAFTTKGESVDNYRNKTPDQEFTPKQYIIVSTDQTFVSTSRTLKEPEEGDEEVEEGDEEPKDELKEDELEEDKPEDDEPKDEVKEEEPKDDEPKKSKTESKAEAALSKKPTIVFKDPKRVKSASASVASAEKSAENAKLEFLGRRLPGVKSKASSGESKESKAEAKESKSEAKESKGAFGSFFLKEKSDSKLEDTAKADSKVESKAKTPRPRIRTKLDPVKESETFGSLKASKAKEPNVTAESDEPAEAAESKKKPTPSKLKPSKRQSAKVAEILSKQNSSKNS
jgi:hypothetical protein